MATFFGSYKNKVDAKGRVSVPARFRAAIDSAGFNGVVVAPAYDVPALDVCEHERITLLAKALDIPERYTPAQREHARWMLAQSEELPFDGEGRVLLPQALRQHAGITSSAVIVGVGPTFQIWSPESHEKSQNEARERARRDSINLRDLPIAMAAAAKTEPER